MSCSYSPCSGALRIHLLLKCSETPRVCCVTTKPCFILLFSAFYLRLRRHLVSILEFAIRGIITESFRELLNHTELLGKRGKKNEEKSQTKQPTKPKKQTTPKPQGPNLNLLSKQRKFVYSFFLQKAHRHLY